MGNLLTMSSAVSALREQQDAVEDAFADYRDKLAIRNDLIRDARKNGLGYPTLGRITGLSRNRLWRIINGGDGGTE